MVSPIFIDTRLTQPRKRWLHSKQSSTVWQVEIPCTKNGSERQGLALAGKLR